MKKKLADVLWEAANVHLSSNRMGMNEWSCNAAMTAEGLLTEVLFYQGESVTLKLRDKSKTDAFLSGLGCDSRDGRGQFNDYTYGIDRQGVRYMWLLLAMHVAEDEGIMVEVAE